MLSRVADSLYWLGRYVERAENIARCIDVNLQLQLDLPGEERPWEPMIQTSGDARAFFDGYGRASLENVLSFLTVDRANPNSIVSCISKARENARCVREAISSEMWAALNKFHLVLEAQDLQRRIVDNPHAFYTEVKECSQLFVGIAECTCNHGEGWHFLRLGRLQERADQTSRMLDVKYFILLPDPSMVGMALDAVQWLALLKSASAFEMFRKRYSTVTPQNVSEFLLLDREFPRSALFCLAGMEESLKAIAGGEPGIGEASLRKLGRLRAELEFATIDEIVSDGMHERIEAFQGSLSDVGHSFYEEFFNGVA